MRKTVILFTTLLLFTIACTNSVENNHPEKITNTIVNQNITIEESLIESKSGARIKQQVKEPTNPSALQQYDEKILFSFKTEKGKTMNIILHQDEKYIVYRFGTENKLELQFPEDLTNTFEQFSYNFYFRGGAAANAGLDLNYLSFTGDTHKFIIFQEYSADGEEGEGESESVGIRIVNLKTKEEIEIKGINSTVSGHLMEFRDNGLVKIIDEI